MSLELLGSFPELRSVVQSCGTIYVGDIGVDLAEALGDDAARTTGGRMRSRARSVRLRQEDVDGAAEGARVSSRRVRGRCPGSTSSSCT